MNTKTQLARLLRHLRAGKTVTVREATVDLGIGSPPRRLLDLKELGHNIGDVWETRNGARYKRWSLLKEK